MIDIEKLSPILDGYKTYFPKHWEAEKYKWEAVKHFQENWNIEAENFGEMFEKATAKTYNLLASGYSYPRGMIINFAKADNERVRQMFRNLYDESQDLEVRVETFQAEAEALRIAYNDGTWRQHYQRTNSISTYLWLNFPDKYYIYKYELCRDASVELNSEYRPKRNGSVGTLLGAYKMYDEICKAISNDEKIVEMVKDAIAATDSCYADTNLKTTTIDFVFYLGRFYLEKEKISKMNKIGFQRTMTQVLQLTNG